MDDLVDYIADFVEENQLQKVILMGNFLGGHVALLYAWKYPALVRRLVLAGRGSHKRVRTYSFFTHTQLIHKLGWLENILITPSHHRVHHSSNEKYLNKNYGDLFVFWDKLFGTFEREDEKPVYGLTHPLKSHSFVWQHFHYFMELGQR